MNKLEVLAVIPARGGSKGIPRKNIRPFSGFPLIAWSIAAARQAETVTRTLVSTDDQEIAAIAVDLGAEVPFMRPAELAQDMTTDLPVFQQVLQWLADNEGYRPEVVVQLRPTSPIRPRRCVDEAVRLLLEHPDADCVRGLVPAGQNPHKMWRIDPESGRMVPLLSVPGIPEPYNAPRQALPPIYWQTGHIDAIRVGTILQKGSMTGKTIFPLLIDPRYTVDMDTPNDWAKAEWLVSFGGLEYVSPGAPRRPMPEGIDLLVMDFDGVLTDNRVWTDQDGNESVASNHSDSEGLSRLRASGVEAVVLSKEVNPVVAARCRKLKLPFLQGIEDKGSALKGMLKERGVNPRRVAYLGNDTNDLPCFQLVGWAVAVADAHPEVLQAADFILSKPGGHGAIREFCDLILKRKDTRA
ncbi:MAG: N-acylneuraminate cytidylyltransferase [Anaerolineales bacterium]